MRNKITITNEANDVLRSVAENAYVSTATRLPNGDWSVPVDDEVYDRILHLIYPGETMSDYIIRAAAYYRSGGKTN